MTLGDLVFLKKVLDDDFYSLVDEMLLSIKYSNNNVYFSDEVSEYIQKTYIKYAIKNGDASCITDIEKSLAISKLRRLVA